MAGKYAAKKTDEGEHAAPRSGGARAWDIIRTVITWVVVIAAVAMMIFTIISVNTFDQNDRDLFGFKAFIVRSDSMKATDFEAGDLVLIQEVDPATLQAGDIIAFRSTDPSSFGETFTHKIRSLTTTGDGEPAFITYGTTTNIDDSYPVTYGQVQGKYQLALPGVGAFFTFLKTVPGYICCILLPFMLLIVMQGVNSVKLFREYKAEQMAEIEAQRKKEMDAMAAERERLAAEREESQKMLEELQRLQAQLGASSTVPEDGHQTV